MKIITWKKPSGDEIKTNDMEVTIAYCKSIGWTRKKGPPKAEKD